MVTQKDIARRLGVSGSLVSHVLGGRGPRIGASAETIRRIEAEVARQGYQRSAVALALRGQSTRMLGVVVKDFEDPYLGHLVGELQRLARESGYALLLTGCEGGAKPTPVLAPLNRYPLEGILLAGSDVAGAWFGTFARQGIRGAQIGTGPRVTGMRRFGVDEAGGMALVTGHLVRWGHRRIAYACDASGAHGRRHVAFEASIRRAGLVPVNVAGWQAESKMDLERALQDRGGLAVQGVTAVVCADDEVAQRVIHAAHSQGVRIPQDLSVTGMDDIPSARLTTPALTTVRQPLGQMIQAAFHYLVTSGAGGAGAATLPVAFSPELVVRESSAAPALLVKQPQARARTRRHGHNRRETPAERKT